jgi:pyrimidine operon attenuation protein/uracil phosphoribosyltransferase
MEHNVLLDEKAIERSITRITHEILEKNQGSHDLCLIGIRTRGVFLAKRIQDKIREIEKKDLPLGILDITMYRDDVFKLKTPEVKKTDIAFNVNNAIIVLVDDVMYTGRTTRAAIDAIMDLGRPRKIQLAVLVDRGSRELPMHPDYTGILYPSGSEVEVFVKLREVDGTDEVLLAAAS